MKTDKPKPLLDLFAIYRACGPHFGLRVISDLLRQGYPVVYIDMEMPLDTKKYMTWANGLPTEYLGAK